MSTIAVYNMKGGVGKTTTAVNLSYLAAAGGRRTLLWDLDPQAASSFAFRIRPCVEGFNKRSLANGESLAAAIKETDYNNLDLLPADFAYRKLDRFLGYFGKPDRVVAALVEILGHKYDVVFLDCPAGFTLLTEGVFAAADAVLTPTIPTVLSLRTVAQLLQWADRSGSTAEMAAFFSMVDRRKTLHRRACEWSAGHSDVFMKGQVPYASVVEQMAVRRMPLPAFAGRDPATEAFAGIWAEVQSRLRTRTQGVGRSKNRWVAPLQAIESLIVRLESTDGVEPAGIASGPRVQRRDGRWERTYRHDPPSHSAPADGNLVAGSDLPSAPRDAGDVHFIHGFDTDGRDLQRSGLVLELIERSQGMVVVAARTGRDADWTGRTDTAHAQVDHAWAADILAGIMSPLAALEWRLGRTLPPLVENLRLIVGGKKLLRIESRVADQAPAGDVVVRQSYRFGGPTGLAPARRG